MRLEQQPDWEEAIKEVKQEIRNRLTLVLNQFLI